MHISYKVKYPVIISFLITGYFLLSQNINPTAGYTLCHFKRITSIPCPACGSTRAVLTLLQGEVWASILINPLGLITSLLFVFAILWMSYDLFRGKETFFPYLKRDSSLRFKIFLLIIFLANWGWNIYKGL